MQAINLPEEYALVLQQIDENGQEDFENLARSLHIARRRVAHIIASLQHKGLVRLTKETAYGPLVELSRNGKHLMHYLWPVQNQGLQPSF